MQRSQKVALMLGLEPVVRSYLTWALSQSGGRLSEDVLRNIWPLVVGRAFARATAPRALVNDRIDVVVPDAVWKSELRYRRDEVLGRLNRLLPDRLGPITRIKVTLGQVVPIEEPVRFERGQPSEIRLGQLDDEQREALDAIEDDELRRVVDRVVRRNLGEKESE